MQFSPRNERLAELEATFFDVLVIGGGITGAAAARDAATRGLKVALLERGDWAGGTSWRSSKLVHGGLRYLRTGEVGLVFESLSERERLLRLAPHLVRPVEFLFPFWRRGGVSPWMVRAGLTLYDLLALGRAPRHRRLSRDELLRLEPLLESPELAGGAMYADARTDDARLTLENVLDAASLGAVAVSRAEVREMTRDASGRIVGARGQDRESGRDFTVSARVVLNAAGPWSDLVRRLDDPSAVPQLRLAKGAHLAIPTGRLPLSHTVVFPAEDRRLLFAIPDGPVTLIGTTDTEYTGSLDEVGADREDVSYLIGQARETFPAALLAESDVVATFAGLRPLLRKPGRRVEDTSREDAVSVSPGGLVTVTGGKLTTHRRMAVKAIDSAARILARQGVAVRPSATRGRRFPGAPDLPIREFPSFFAASTDFHDAGLETETGRHLAWRYGSRAAEVVALAVKGRALGRPIVAGLPDIDAEIVFAARSEDARSISDVFIRRTHLFWQAPGQGEEAIERAADLLARELSWTARQRQAAVEEYEREVSRSRRFRA